MSSSTRNLAVGFFVLAALGLLGWMIITFSTQPRVFSKTWVLRMNFPNAASVAEGSDVRVSGVLVGHVRTVRPINGFLEGVQVVADIEGGYDIPRQAEASIQTGGLGLAKSAIEIEIPPGAGPEILPKDGQAVLQGQVVSGMERLFPAAALRQVVEDMHQLLQPLSPEEIDRRAAASQPANGNLSTVVQRLDQVIERMNVLLAGHGDIAVTLANLHKVSANAVEISETFKDFANRAVLVADSANVAFRTATTQLDRIGGDAGAAMQTANAQLKRIGDAMYDNSAQLAKALDTLNRALSQIAEGKGTAGRLLNDPALYESMLLATDRLHKTIIDMQALVQKWQAEGMQIKLK